MKTIRGPFRKQVASDIVRDGLGVELLSGDLIVADVFRCDADHSLTVTTFNNHVPPMAIEELVAVARDRLREFEDGTPLPVYVSPAAEQDHSSEPGRGVPLSFVTLSGPGH